MRGPNASWRDLYLKNLETRLLEKQFLIMSSLQILTAQNPGEICGWSHLNQQKLADGGGLPSHHFDGTRIYELWR